MKEEGKPTATSDGRLFFTTEEFFKRVAVKKIIKKAENSKLVRDIIKNTKSW